MLSVACGLAFFPFVGSEAVCRARRVWRKSQGLKGLGHRPPRLKCTNAAQHAGLNTYTTKNRPCSPRLA